MNTCAGCGKVGPAEFDPLMQLDSVPLRAYEAGLRCDRCWCAFIRADKPIHPERFYSVRTIKRRAAKAAAPALYAWNAGTRNEVKPIPPG